MSGVTASGGDTDAVLRGWALAGLGLVAAATWWDPQWPVEQALHNSLTVLALVLLAAARRRYRLPLSSYLVVLAFLGLHMVAARWIYSFVPYDDWADAVFGVRPSEVFGWRRNHFDRLVHACYGAAAAAVVFRHLRDRRAVAVRGAARRAIEVVLSTSALYELFEWGIAVALAPAAAEAYNGQQGDIWDAHRDMALATAAALVVALALAARERRRSTGRGRPSPTQRERASTLQRAT